MPFLGGRGGPPPPPLFSFPPPPPPPPPPRAPRRPSTPAPTSFPTGSPPLRRPYAGAEHRRHRSHFRASSRWSTGRARLLGRRFVPLYRKPLARRSNFLPLDATRLARLNQHRRRRNRMVGHCPGN